MLTITYPNSDRSLLTLAELQAAAGTTTMTDAELLLLGDYVSAIITKACKVPEATLGAIPPTLRDEGVTETFRFKSRQGFIALGRKPVIEINSVLENGAALGTTAFELDGSLLYKISGDHRCYWICGDVEVDYMAGYAEVPPDLKYAATKFLRTEMVTSSGRDPLLKRKTIEGVSTYEYWVDPTKTDMIVPAEVMDILENGGYVTKFGWMR